MNEPNLDSDFCAILARTVEIGQALSEKDPEKVLQLTLERQTFIDEIERKKAEGIELSQDNHRQLAEIIAAGQPLQDDTLELLEQYREALSATRQFRKVKAYLAYETERSLDKHITRRTPQ